ncbi:hypothetical protein P4I20_21155 [Paenibacillus graminis]|uniref:hypothetical protein n=1 Tax=Paenibacillus graminis TaxID=189425 RepID=UPI002DBBD3B9|nr:hypothetical protein [Paenibacillus graminis]MEC0168875.1 hypothetical protein [Paenibacillus graminis]
MQNNGTQPSDSPSAAAGSLYSPLQNPQPLFIHCIPGTPSAVAAVVPTWIIPL